MKRRSFLQIVASLPLAPTIARVLVGAGAALAPTTANAGLAFSKFWQRLFGKKEMRILMLGLDAAGKTTILYKLKLGEVLTTPSEGLNVETVEYKNIGFTVWDLGGPGSQSALVSRYYQNTQAIVFVVDSNDSDRMDGAAGAAVSAKSELARLLGEEALRKAILLVFANKQDLPNSNTVAEITERLGLSQIKDRAWYIQAACATTGDGLYEGLDWASQQLAKK